MSTLLERLRGEFFPKPDAFDVARGVNTSGLKSLMIRRLWATDTRRYQAVDEERFAQAVEGIPRWTFIDVGCGRGKPLILAHEAGFTNLIGVELDPGLCRDARENLTKLGIKAQIYCADATNFTFPDEPCVVFFHNPFGAEPMKKVLSRLGSKPRYLVYLMPYHENVFNFPLIRSGDKYRVFAT
jgi:SAM-dependent methyltransferase